MSEGDDWTPWQREDWDVTGRPLVLSRPAQAHNQQAFETCIALTLQILAAVEFAPVLHRDRPTWELLLAFAAQAERHGQDLMALARCPGTDVCAAGAEWYAQLAALRDEPLQVAYWS